MKRTLKSKTTGSEYPESIYPTKFDSNGKRWMLCQNSNPESKYWKGKECNIWERVDANSVSVLCWKCTANFVGFPEDKPAHIPSDKPKGWKFMKEFVAKDGTVYHKGVEQPALKGTLDPTVVQPKEPKKKLSKQEKEDTKNALGQEIQKLKNELFKESRKGKRAELTKALTKANRELKKFM
jgi:hypothetical protein